MILISTVAVQQGFAKKPEFPQPPVSGLIGSVSNPSGDCVNLGLKGWYGTVTISFSRLWVFLQHANMNSTYIIYVGYVMPGGSCNGTWRPVGSVNTDAAGEGSSMQWFTPSSGYSYCVFKFEDSLGNVVFATNSLAI